MFTVILALSLLGWTPQKTEVLFGAEQRDAVLMQFEARYREARSLSATFLEEYSENGKVTRKEAGKSYFLHPGKMRWDYEAPEKNTFLADGKYVWFITPADHTATRMPAKKSEDWRTPLALLTDGIKALADLRASGMGSGCLAEAGRVQGVPLRTARGGGCGSPIAKARANRATPQRCLPPKGRERCSSSFRRRAN